MMPLELWAGLECSVVRIGDHSRDQVLETGHDQREDDLERIASLGISTLRYPALWERVAPDHPDDQHWEWLDARMARLRALQMRPILGLVHHGSGPHYTNLLDDAFASGLARHAESVARRYPWVEDWTPVNEPVTTARFCGLYGHWYPHHRSLAAFCRMLANQCLAVAHSMRAIRRHIPRARLVHTDDLGCTHATSALRYQAEHENERRWLSYDLLCGRVNRQHPWYTILLRSGVPEATLDEFQQGEAAPDILGANHYLTSERFLDEDISRYPAEYGGGNGAHCYADVEAVRIHPPPGPIGPYARLREMWQRYRRPMAVTEAHHGAPDIMDNVRWLHEVWTAGSTLRAEGADIRAVTIWSLFGSVDWRSLLVQRAGIYEPGPYDVSSNPPHETELALAARGLAQSGRIAKAAAAAPGWWRRPERFYPGQLAEVQ
jgi:dTDP-4-dehydrorhamnose reductase